MSWFKKRPFLTALIVLLLLVVPGFLRLEHVADKANATANEQKLESDREIERQNRELELSCQTRNTFQQNTRTKFARFIDAVEVAFVAGQQDPARVEATKQFIGQLRASVETRPEDEDRDCNNDGKYDAKDYLPA